MSNKLDALWRQGQRYTQQKLWRQAASAYQAILDHAPDFLPAWLELSTAYEHQDAYRSTLESIRNAAKIRDVPPLAGLAVARRLRKFESVAELRSYIEDNGLAARLPAEKIVDLATFISSAGLHDTVIGWIEHALKLRPAMAEGHNLHGLSLMFVGRSQDAIAAFERALALRPQFSSVYAVLSRLAPITPENNRVDALRRFLSSASLPAKDESNFAYALHNELHELGDYDGAWHALSRACRARRSIQPYDHSATLRTFDALKRTFDEEFSRGSPHDSELTPIFIVGLHRSGTTLLERILSGHPDVADAGETYVFAAQLRWEADHFCNVIVDQTIAERAAGFDYTRIARGFLEGMRMRSRGRAFITEKQNPNFILLGPIAKALPQAKLLHMKRNPADTCFSNLRTLFTKEAAYSYDQIEVADYYKAYRELMAHWHQVLPGRVLDIEYDEMVADAQAQSERIARYCGLQFHPQMLDVGRSTGSVATASSNQVRKGIMKDRGGLWRAYERHLGPMLDRLAAHGLL